MNGNPDTAEKSEQQFPPGFDVKHPIHGSLNALVADRDRLAADLADLEAVRATTAKHYVEEAERAKVLAAEVAELKTELEARRKVSSEHDARMVELSKQFTDATNTLSAQLATAQAERDAAQKTGDANARLIADAVRSGRWLTDEEMANKNAAIARAEGLSGRMKELEDFVTWIRVAVKVWNDPNHYLYSAGRAITLYLPALAPEISTEKKGGDSSLAPQQDHCRTASVENLTSTTSQTAPSTGASNSPADVPTGGRGECPKCGVKGWIDVQPFSGWLRCRACKSEWFPPQDSPAKLLPFDLSRALKGERVVTRDGREATRIIKSKDGGCDVLLVVVGGCEDLHTLDGSYLPSGDAHPRDLFMSPEGERR